MTPRLNPFAAAPAPMKAWLDYSQSTQKNGLEESLIGLVEIRASQVNGCARCLDMHTADARKRGETEQRLYLLDAWRDLPLFNERERVALTLLIVVINGWNRINVGFRAVHPVEERRAA